MFVYIISVTTYANLENCAVTEFSCPYYTLRQLFILTYFI